MVPKHDLSVSLVQQNALVIIKSVFPSVNRNRLKMELYLAFWHYSIRRHVMYQAGSEAVSFWEKFGKELLKKSLILFASVAAHVLVLVLLVIFYSPIKILVFEGEIRNVFIAPSFEKLVLPEQAPVSLTLEAEKMQAGPVQPVLAAAAIPERSAPVSDVPELVLPEINELPSRLAQDFNLRLEPETPLVVPRGLSFQLAPELTRPAYEYSPGPDRQLPKGALDKYIQSVDPRLLSKPANRPVPGSASAVSVQSQSGPARADITRWADTSVTRILANWFIPLLMTDQEDDEIVIALTVQTDGWIVSTEVLQPGRVPELQAAALKALELSVPLPRLPREYPEKSLQIQVVFARK